MKAKLQKIKAVFVCLLFVLMFFEINYLSVVSIIGLKYPNNKSKDIVTYYLPSGELIPVGDYEWKYIHADFVLSIEPVMDNFLRSTFPDGFIRHKYFPDRHRAQVKLKKIDDFRKESLASVPLVAISSRRGYFESMDYVSSGIDQIITGCALPEPAKLVYEKRQGKARLRPFMSYLAYDLAGGSCRETGMSLAAISEANNLHLYCHNYLLDGKRTDIKEERLVSLLSAGQFFSDLTSHLVCRLDLPANDRLAIINRLATEVDLTYLGQIADQKLTIATCPNSQDEYLPKYLERCRLLSGPMYGLSTWLGYIASGNYSKAELAYQSGSDIGLMMQIINDIADFSEKKPDALADWRAGKMTAPLFFLKKSFPGKEADMSNLARLMVSSGAYASSLTLVKEARELARQSLLQITGGTDHLLCQVLAAGKDNKYFRQLKSLEA